MTTVVNVKHSKYDIFGMRGSLIGNPFEIGRDGTRDEVCDKFDIWFNHLLKSQVFKRELLKCKGKRLGCCCKQPDREVRCHLDLVARYLNSLPD